jgi:ankyrin repeat protein
MTLHPLGELVEAAPTEGSIVAALATLKSLAREGDLEATVLLMRAVGRAVAGPGAALDVPFVSTREALLELSDVPAMVRIFGFVQQPRAMLALGPGAAGLAGEPIPPSFLAGLQRLVATDDLLQHEALKLFVVTSVVHQAQAFSTMRVAVGNRLNLLERALRDTCVVPGDNADDALRFGRGLLLRVSDVGGLLFVIHHELAHHLVFAPRQAVHDGDHADIAAAAGGLVDAAVAAGPTAIGPDDRRMFRSSSGVIVLCSQVSVAPASYFHCSLSDSASSLDLERAATIALVVLDALAVDRGTVAAAYSSRGLFHFGWQPGASAPAPRSRDRGAAVGWLGDLRATGRLGASERDVAVGLGLLARAPVFHGLERDRTLETLEVAGRLASLERMPALTGPHLEMALVSAWCTANGALLQRILDASPAARDVLVGSQPRVGAIGVSLGVVAGDGSPVYRGPRLQDVFATLALARACGVDLDGPIDASGRTLLTTAVTRDPRTVRFLLDLGLQPDRQDANGVAPLLRCAASGAADAAAMLLEAGAAPDASDSLGETPLMRAAKLGHVELARVLLSHGADANAATLAGETALHRAVLAPPDLLESCVTALLDADADINEETDAGMTPLMTAASTARVAAVELLLGLGANPNVASRVGDTALMMAIEARDVRAVELLMAAGASVMHANAAGETSLRLAAAEGVPDEISRLVGAWGERSRMVGGDCP